MILAAVIVCVVLVLLLAGLVERGYATRFWSKAPRFGRGRFYDDR